MTTVRELVTKLGFDAKDAQKSADKFDKTMNSVKTALVAVTAAATAAGGALFGITKSTSDAGDRLAKLSQQTGIAAQEIQGLQYAAELAGISTEELNNSLSFFNVRASEAQEAGDPAQLAMQELGVSVRNANGELKRVWLGN
ncbi:MAG TPA: hypothetical protein DCX53_06735, partial [Anaerolineae bacterium]|nr:hypothetical protein [Anaerolineae bacterium]